jgi:hypothetical protein
MAKVDDGENDDSEDRVARKKAKGCKDMKKEKSEDEARAEEGSELDGEYDLDEDVLGV